MVTSPRPNFFLLLGLSPITPWDQAAFEKILREKRIEWSRQSAGVAKRALLAKQNLALIPTIQKVMTDAPLREEEAMKAHAELASARSAEYAYFERQLAFMNAKETVDQEEVARFVQDYKHLLSAEEIVSRIQVKVGAPNTTQIFASQILDSSIFQNINDRLKFIRLNTIYELLQRSSTTATPDLLRATEQLYSQLVSLPTTAENSAKVELTGLALNIFKSDEARARYDESIRQEALVNLLKELDDVMNRSASKEISHRQVLLFLDQIQQAGWQKEEALHRLGEHVRLLKWSIATPMISPLVQKLLCPGCGHLNVPDQHFCTTCNAALYVDCPQCGISVSCECAACGNCGFVVGNRYLVDSLLKDLPGLLEDGDIQRAGEVIYEAVQAWPSTTQDARTRQIEAYRSAILLVLQAQQQARSDVVEHLGQLKISEISSDTQHWVSIGWTPPAQGTVVILKSAQSLHQEGNVLKATQLNELGQFLRNRGNFAADTWNPSEVIYYTPAIVLVQDAYLGISQPFACIENVKDLSCQQLGSVLRLRWIWPEGCDEVDISYSTQQWPHSDDRTTTTLLLQRLEYDQLGYYDLGNISKRNCYIVIAAIIKKEEQLLTAQGKRLFVRLADKSVITYEIRRSIINYRKRTLHLALDLRKSLPVLLIVSKQGGLPFRKTDGDLFYRIKVTAMTCKNIVIDLPSSALPPGTFGKLFLEDDTVYHEFTVHHPNQDQMRLS